MSKVSTPDRATTSPAASTLHPLDGAEVRVAIVGSGFSGLAVAIRLKREGIHDFVVVEQRTVWVSGGCHSWYLDPRGRNTVLWPCSTWRFRRLTRAFDVAAYQTTRPLADSEPARTEARRALA